MPDFSRRTVVRGTAWTVPVIAVAAHAPAFAASHEPPPPGINFGGACGNTGATQKGCGGKFTLQVPLTLSNPGATAYVFQITSMYTRNERPAPTGPGTGIESGVMGIYATPSHTVPNHNNCTKVSYNGPCGGTGVTGGSVLVPAGTTSATYWIQSPDTGSADDFAATITWQILDAATCAVLSDGTAATPAEAIPPANCNGD